MSWVAAAVGAVGVISSLDSGRRMANTASDAQRMSQQQFGQTGKNLAPFLQAGQTAMSNLADYTGVGAGGLNPNAPGVKPFSLADFQASPAYNFNLQQGQQAIDKASNARGNLYAPQTLQDLSKYSQGMASNEFTNAYNMYNQNQGNTFSRLNTLAGMGQNAAVQQGGFGAAAAGAAGNYGIMGGEATSAGYTGAVGNALNGGTQAYNNYLQNQILQRQQQSQYGPQYGGDAYGGSSGWAP